MDFLVPLEVNYEHICIENCLLICNVFQNKYLLLHIENSGKYGQALQSMIYSFIRKGHQQIMFLIYLLLTVLHLAIHFAVIFIF